MPIDNIRARVTASIWQAIAQSGVELSSLDKEQQEVLVSNVTDAMLVTIDQVFSEVSEQQPKSEVPTADGEQILWQGRPFLSLVETYAITNERLKIVKGLLARDIENYELIRVQDIDLSQKVSERIFGIGDITIRGQDASKPMLVLRNIPKPEEVYEILRKAWLEARKRYGLQFREYL